MGERLLAIRLRALGDVVLTTPALRALRRGFPGMPLDVVTDRRYAPLLEGMPGIDRVLVLERSSWASLALAARLRRERYALAVDFFGNPRSALLTAACGARRSAGYDIRGRRYAYRLRVPRNIPPVEGRHEYAAASHLRLAVAAGGIDDGLEVRLAFPERIQERARVMLATAGVTAPERTVAIVPAGTWPTKTWPISHFVVLSRSLIQAGWPLVAITGPGEERVTAALARHVPEIAVLPPCPDVMVLAAVIGELAALVGTDSGPRHLAVALGLPTFSWFGPGRPDLWTRPDPRHATWWTELPCRGCNRTQCPHWNCMPGLAPQRAAELTLSHLEGHVRSAADLRPAARA